MNKIIASTLAAGMLVSFAATAQSKKEKLSDGIYANITTDKGLIVLKLEDKKSPMTVANFVGLAEGKFTFQDTLKFTKPYYDGLKFHRVIPNFMIQGGDPTGTGSSGPGYKFYDETDTDLKHTGSGILSMANAGPATNGSQFFITHTATPWLDGKHTIFGKVITGQDVVDAIAQDDVMKSVKIVRVGKVAKKFNATTIFNTAFNEIGEKYKREAAEIERVSKLSKEDYSAEMLEQVKKIYPTVESSKSGLLYIIEKTGDQQRVEKGHELTIHYKGTFRKDGKQFDSSYDRNQPMKFSYLEQRMIPGFEEGLKLIGKGGKIKIIIPYFDAYGANGRPGAIPPFADLVFDLEILDIHDHSSHEGHGH